MEIKERTINTTRKKLGFTATQSDEMVTPLKISLANYQMLYHKLRNFHWNVDGSDFFELHEEFESDYTELFDQIDILAERIRVFNVKPMLSLEVISDMSEIEDIKDELSSREMVSTLVEDFNILHNKLLDALDVALSIGDNVSEQMITDLMRFIEKRNWMYTAWLRK
jgi:starvation-inducible DNA-binding protein